MGDLRVAWWNLENLFDTDDDPMSADFEFTRAEGWTPELLAAKIANLAAVINQLHADAGPELLGVAEVEGDDVFADLLAATGNSNLEVVRDDAGTSDLRGIDVSIAFDNRKLAVVEARSHTVYLRYATRDIFEVVFALTDTGRRLVVIASHWPSRRLGQLESQPTRITVAENIAFLVRDHVRFSSTDYLERRAQGDLAAVRERFDTPVLIMGDFNDEPSDRSVVHHLQASSELDRVVGPTNDIDRFVDEVADYRNGDNWLYNPMWKFLPQENTGTFFLASTSSGERFANRYQVLDQLVASRGLLIGDGPRLDVDSVAIHRTPSVATPSFRPRPFNRSTGKGTSDHLPLTATIRWP
ncbi:MAG: endonuclease/exonuclease/phosphatase family protein [Acidimicrobiales bacterium]